MRLRIFIATLLAAGTALAELQPQTVTPAGTTAKNAQAVQGATGGVPLHTVCDSGCGGASSFLDLAAFVAGTTAINVAGGVYDDTLTAVVSGKAAAPRMTSKRALHFNLRDNSGNEIPFPAALVSGGFNVNVGNTVTVSGTVAVTQSTSPWVTADNHTTAAAPLSLRLSDGAAFYNTITAAQLPAALDGSGFLKVHEQGTATVSGTVAVSNSFALDATLTGGSQIAQVKSGTKGASAAALVTSTANGVDHQGLDVQLQNATVAVTESGTWTVQPGNTANTTPWLASVNDGTNTAAVKAASTAAAATDKALVVAVSPNNTIAATESGTWTVQPGNTANTTPWLVAGNVTPATAFANPTTAVTANALMSGFNGTTWDRLVSQGNNNDAEAVATTGVLDAEAHNMVFNGTTWDRQRGSTTGTNVIGTAAEGAAQVGNPVAMAGRGFNGVNFSPRYCDKTAQITTLGTTATVQQIAAVASQKIYICGYFILASTATTATTLKWTEGTGANCVTGQTNVTPLIFTTPTVAPTTANWTLGPFGGGALPWTTTAADALCITQTSATNSTTLSGVIFYTQN